MNYRNFNKDGAPISLLGYGLMRMPTDKDGEIDYKRAKALVDTAYKSGVTYFDTAYGYHGGKSELFAAKALADYPRESYLLADKMPLWSAEKPEDIDEIFDDQLKKCNTEYFDFYLVHAMNKDIFEKVKRLGVYEKLAARKAAGQIKRLGFSFHDSVETLCEVLDSYKWDFVQLQLNYFDWSYQDAKGQYEAVTSRGLQVIVMEPVRGGSLVSLTPEADELLHAAHPDRSVASWAMRFAAQLDGVLCVLSGMSTEEALSDNLASLSDGMLMTKEERELAFRAADIMLKSKTVPCTACNYCAECPRGIAIPKLFKMANDYAIGGDKNWFMQCYNKLTPEEKPFNCINCGACSSRCPQHIDIPAELAKIDRMTKELQKR